MNQTPASWRLRAMPHLGILTDAKVGERCGKHPGTVRKLRAELGIPPAPGEPPGRKRGAAPLVLLVYRLLIDAHDRPSAQEVAERVGRDANATRRALRDLQKWGFVQSSGKHPARWEAAL